MRLGTSPGIYKITLALIEGLDSLPNADSHSLIGTRHDKAICLRWLGRRSWPYQR